MSPERAAATVGALALVLACGDSDGAPAGTGGSDGSGGDTTGATTPTTETGQGSQSGSTTDASSTGPADTSAGESTTGPDVELQHGFVRVQLQRAAEQPADPFVGTERVQITLNYEQLHFRRMGPGGGTLSYGNQLPGDHYIVLGEREGSTATNADLGDIWFDAVFARALADLDPTSTIGDEEDVP